MEDQDCGHVQRMEVWNTTQESKLEVEDPGAIASGTATKAKVPVRLWSVVYSVFTACLLALLLGATLSFSSPTLVYLNQLEDPHFRFNTKLSDVFGAAAFMGGVFGGPFGGWVADKFGRKTSLALDAMPFVSGYFIILSSSLASNGAIFKVLLIAGRFLTGIGLGWAHVAVAVYIGEIAPARSRGIFATISELSVTTGIMLSLALGSIPGLHYYHTALVLITIVAVFIWMVLWVPETPRWLLLHSKDQREAVAAMRCLRGPQYPKITEDIEEIQSTIPKKAPSLCKLMRQLLCVRATAVPFLLLIFVFGYQRGGGVGPLLAYVGPIFFEVGVPYANLTATFSIGGLKVLFTLVSVVLIEFIGRKVLLAVSSAGMFLSLLLLGAHSFVTRPSLCTNSTPLSNLTTAHLDEEVASCNPQLYPLVIVGIMMFHIAYSLGVGPVPWVLLSEYLPLKVRGLAGGMAVAAAWGAASVITGSFLSFSEALGAWSAWWALSGINLAGFLVIVLFFVETKGRKLEEVRELFAGRTCVRCLPSCAHRHSQDE